MGQMKFKSGDRIRVIENGFTARIKAISFNSIYQQEEYYVTWDNDPKQDVGYPVDECDPIWELECPVVAAYQTGSGVITLPTAMPPGLAYWLKVGGKGEMTIMHEPDKVKTGCDHQWAEYTGLMESYKYCKHCDEKKAL